MDFDASSQEEWRSEIRTFLRGEAAELLGCSTMSRIAMHLHDRAQLQDWSRALDRKGWLVPHWPLKWGGQNWPGAKRRILNQELFAANCPVTDAIGTDFVAPVIYMFGTAEQQQRHLPRIRSADEFWCQGFSESQAGSDISSVRTTAVRDGNQFVINGHKMWTSNAHNADMMFALVRIDTAGVRRQPGPSFLLIDLHVPGVEVRPIITIDGGHWINEVFLSDVRVPAGNLVGEPGKGWAYARYLLGNERTIVAGLPQLHRLLKLAREVLRLSEDRSVCADRGASRSRLARFEIEYAALEMMERRLEERPQDDPYSQVLTSMLKLRSSELRQIVSAFAFDLLGVHGLERPSPDQPDDARRGEAIHVDDWAAHCKSEVTAAFLIERAATIAGGTSEVQRNIIAAIGLGL